MYLEYTNMSLFTAELIIGKLIRKNTRSADLTIYQPGSYSGASKQ